MKIFSAKQLSETDQKTTEKQEIHSSDLMERAGIQVFNWLDSNLKNSQVPIHVFCGIGNNGGDGLVVARLLIEKGYNVQSYIVNYSDKRSENFLLNYNRFKNITKNWPVMMTSKDDFPKLASEDIIVDAIFGTGLNRPPKSWVKNLIVYINSIGAYKLAIDMPSGLYANRAQESFDSIIKANTILTFGTPKLSFFMPDTLSFAPYFEILDIGLDTDHLESLQALAQLIHHGDAQLMYKPREKGGYKGDYGHTVIVAGSYGKIGAAYLSAHAAYKIGAGLVTAFIPKCGYNILQNSLPEAMVLTDLDEMFISEINIPFEPDAVAIGMGIGTNKLTVKALKIFLGKMKKPLVIDADALNIISENTGFLKLIPKNSVLTPHPGELKRLIGVWKDDYDKLDRAKKFANEYNLVLVIKGANTMVIYNKNIYINTTGNFGMATGGSGDVLSGVIAGLISQGYDPLLAAIFGVYQHGMAGDIASQKLSYEAMLAGDIIDNLGRAYIHLFQKDETKNQDKV